jgi:hypothetical protein
MGNHGRPKEERKLKNMKNRKTVFIVTVLALAFALAPRHRRQYFVGQFG